MNDHRGPSEELGISVPLITPLYQSSVFTLPDLDALDRVAEGGAAGFIYARDAHPNARRLASLLAEYEAADWGLINSSGMASISAIALALLKQGDRVVASDQLYGRTIQLFQNELGRFGIETEFVDMTNLEAVRAALGKPARMLFVETLSNPLLRLCDVEALASLAHEHNCVCVVDNTFATPEVMKPLTLGADLVMESLTKMIGGHSDVTLGLVCGKGEDRLLELTQVSSIWGFSSNPFDCWLTERSLPTVSLRMRAASANAEALANWLPDQPNVLRVVYPGREEHPDRELATRILQGGFGNMLCVEVSDGREGVNRFMRRATGIPFSPSLGNTSTTCSHPATTSHRYVSPAERQRQGIGDGLIRLSVGVEPLESIQREIRKGLE